MTPSASLVEIHLLQLPVALAERSRQHFEELLREFALIAAGSAGRDGRDGRAATHQVPVRLTELVDALTVQFAGVNNAADQELEDAIDAHLTTLEDHLLLLPPAAGAASRALGAMIDEADDYCRQGEHLLTLASPPECVAYRGWYLGQVIAQLDGEPPVAWPDSVQARSL